MNTHEKENQELVARLKAIIEPQIGTKNVGVIIGIYDQGKETYLSFGETALGNKSKPEVDTIFEIGSLTKPLTGLMLARLIESGKISAKDSVSKFIPELKNQKTGEITLAELVTHTSGLPRLPCNLHYKHIENPYADYSEKDLIEGLRNSSFTSGKCKFEGHPTATANYSNWGFGLLGYILARSQNTTYETLLKELVLSPLGLTHTTLSVDKHKRKKRSQGHTADLKATPFWDHQTTHGAGAVLSTAHDLLLYARALLHPEGTPLRQALKLSITPVFKTEPNDLAFAWFVRPSGNYWHDGMTGGFSSFIKIYPGKDRAVLYLSNTAHELEGFLDAVEK